MSFRKYITAIFVNKNVIPYQFKNTRTLQMALGCWMLGKYPILLFPIFTQEYGLSLEMLPPIILATIFLSIPLTFFTLGISQYTKKGWIKLWDAAPVWRGVGIAGLLCLYISTLFNALLCTYFLYYAIRSLEVKTPWLECDDQDFMGEGCFTYMENRSMHLDCMDLYSEKHCSQIVWKSSAEYFLENTVKFRKRDDQYHFNSELVPYQIGVTIMVYICLRNSTASLALFSPFLLIFPTLLHGILLIRSFVHPGILRSLEVMCHFKFSNFMNLKFWLEIGTMSLYSTGFAYGGLSNFGMQYNFRNPINIDAVFINLANVTYSVLYTIFIYNMCGILSYELNIPVEKIVALHPEANFVQCPLGFAHLPMTKFWTFIFFFSNFLVMLRGLATQCEMFLCVLYEIKPSLRAYTIPCALVFCIIHSFWSSFTNYELFHDFLFKLEHIVTYDIFPALAFYLYIFIEFFYGVMHFVDDMHFMLGFRPSNIWKLNWYLGFLVNLGTLIYGFYTFQHSGHTFLHYILMILTILICLFPMIYFMIFVLIKFNKKETWTEIFKSTKDWGPRDEVLRKSRDMFSAHDMTKEYLYRQQRLKFKTADLSTSKINASLNVNI